MNSKKAQSQIITTILIILLVLAAIIIVWQVFQNTVSEGANEIQDQSQCIGVRVDITNVDLDANSLVIRSTEDLDGYLAYVNGERFGPEGGALTALSTVTISAESGQAVSEGDEIEVIGLIGDTSCPGSKKIA